MSVLPATIAGTSSTPTVMPAIAASRLNIGLITICGPTCEHMYICTCVRSMYVYIYVRSMYVCKFARMNVYECNHMYVRMHLFMSVWCM